MFVYTCKQGEEVLIERAGRYHKTVDMPGLHLKSPFDRVAARVSTRQSHQALNVKAKTNDDVFIGIPVNVAIRISDSKKYHYGALDAQSQLGVLLDMSIRQEVAAMTLAEAADCGKALQRIMDDKKDMLRDTYGIELISIQQQGLDLPEAVKKAFEAAGVSLRTATDKEHDGKAASFALQQGLQNDVTVRKPLSLKKAAHVS